MLGLMILVVVDDLLFRSKISSAAKIAGVQIGAARSPEAALTRAREEKPSLIILDLDSTTTRPFDLLQELSNDPDLAAVPTLGFVSHVRADLIREARAAGIGEVLARSAFASNVVDILSRYKGDNHGPC